MQMFRHENINLEYSIMKGIDAFTAKNEKALA